MVTQVTLVVRCATGAFQSHITLKRTRGSIKNAGHQNTHGKMIHETVQLNDEFYNSPQAARHPKNDLDHRASLAHQRPI